MRRTWGIGVFAVGLLLASLSAGRAYDNDGRGRTIEGGPHRKINELALKKFLTDTSVAPWGEFFHKRYTFKDALQLTGPAVIEPGMEVIKTGDRKGPVAWWVAEGGYTADEPELYNSFRHFYDPLQVDGVPYLTDHLTELDYIYKAFIFGTKIGHAVGLIAGTNVNPKVDARSWAITGEAKNGFGENEYCWRKGAEYMRKAFAETGNNKDRLFAQAWRALGETMHLLGDMTCVPHVRNDSHPGRAIGQFVPAAHYLDVNTDPNLGTLRNDPYELLVSAPVVEAMGKGEVVDEIRGAIDRCKTPEDLFHVVALFTNQNFFSADTISGKFLTVSGDRITNANGRPPYPSPKLEECRHDAKTHYFTREIGGRTIRMAHITWLGEQGWGESSNGMHLSSACVKDQAGILIPVAVHANAKLADWFVPKLVLQITDVDVKTRRLQGKLVHVPYGAYDKPMLYSSNKHQFSNVFVDGSLQKWDNFHLDATDGVVSGNLGAVNLDNAKEVAIEMEVGGILVRSEPFPLPSKQDVAAGATVAGAWNLVRTDEKELPVHKDLPRHVRVKTTIGANSVTTDSGSLEGVRPHQVWHYNVNLTWERPPAVLRLGEKYPLKVTYTSAGTGTCWPGRGFYVYHDDHQWYDAKPYEPKGTSVYHIYGLSPEMYGEKREFVITLHGFLHHPNYESCGFWGGKELKFTYRWVGPLPQQIPVWTDPDEGCVRAGTLVTLADGTRRPIEEVRPFDRIRAYDTEARHPCDAVVEKVLVHRHGPFPTSILSVGDGRTLELTANHPILTREGEWLRVDALTPGLTVYVLDRESGKVEEHRILAIVRDQGVQGVVYNLKTSRGNYFANDVLVHNKCLAAGSLVDTPAGPRAVETLRPGDVVWSETAGRRVPTKVTHVYTKTTVLPSLPGKRLAPDVLATANHRVRVDGAFVRAGATTAPDAAITGPVYDLQTEAGNYYAGGLLMTAD